MSFTVRKPGTAVEEIADLGITINGTAGGEERDLRDISAQDISLSTDLQTLIAAGDLVVLDPRDDSTALSIADGELARLTANDAHFGVNGGAFAALDAPGASLTDQYIVKYDSASGNFIESDGSETISNNQDEIAQIVADLLDDGTDTNVSFNPAITPIIQGQDETNYNNTGSNGTFLGVATGVDYVTSDILTMSDGSTITVDSVSGGDITAFTVTTNSGNVTAGATITQVSVAPANGQTGFTITPQNPNIKAGSLAVNVDDSFLRNTGDTLDSGTLTVASGATIAVATGGSITAVDAPTNDTDLANKLYVDTVATGLDFKESAHMCTVSDLVATYNNGTAGLGATLTGSSNGVLPPSITDDHAHYSVGTRVLVKSQTDPIENGIYEVTDTGTGEEVTKVVTAADSGDSLDGTYFEFNASAPFFVWYNTSGGSATVPAGTGTAIEVAINTNAVAALVTNATIAAINASAAAVVAYADEADIFYIVDDAIGARTDAVDVDSGFTITTAIDGIAVGTPFILTRTTDADNSPSNEVSGGMFIFVEDGATCASTGWVLTEPSGVAVIGTDDLVFSQFSGSGTFVAGTGIDITGNTISMDINNMSAATIDTADEMAFNDVTDGVSKNTTVSDFISDLDVVTSAGLGTGHLVKTADDTYVVRTIASSAVAGDEGISIVNGDGVSGNPTIGLDIAGLTATSDVTVTDRVAVWDGTNNVFYTVAELAGAVSSADSFKTWTAAGNATGDASIVATSATDTATITGGIGINLNLVASTDTVTYSFSRSGMADTAVVGADTVPFFDSGNSNEPEFRSWTNIISDLSIATAAFSTVSGDSGSGIADGPADTLNIIGTTSGGITTVGSDGPENLTIGITAADLVTGSATLATGDFIVVNDSADTAATVSQKYTFGTMISDLGILTGISAATNEDLLGIDVTGTVIGLDILGLTNPAENMATGDEFAIHNKSEGTAGANRKMTGQEVADGTATILGITGISMSTFTAEVTPGDDQTLLSYIDTTRSNKVLSVETTNYEFSDNKVKDNDWFKIGKAGHADSGYIMPLAGTIVRAAAHTRDTGGGNTWDLDVYIDAVDSGAVASLAGGQDASTTTTLDLDFAAGDKIRIRADNTLGGGDMKDTTVTLYIQWRVV